MPPNPGEIVSSRRFGLMIRALEKEADLVIVDSPAMLAVGDTAALAAKVDGLVFLVDPHTVKRPVLMQAAEQLAKLPVTLLGVVLRADGISGGRYGYYGGYNYGYGYNKPYVPSASAGSPSGSSGSGSAGRGASASAASAAGEPGENGARKKAPAKTRA